MNDERDLAIRLRQAIQGCTVHMHGPIQAWQAIEDARSAGIVDFHAVAKFASDACDARMTELRKQGISENDLRIKKELITKKFILALFT